MSSISQTGLQLLKDRRYTDQRVKSTTSVVRKCQKYLSDNFASFTVLHRVAMASYTHVANIWEVEAHGQHEFSAKIHQKLCSWCEKMSSNIETNVHFDTFSSSCFLSQHFDYGRDVWFMSWCSKLCTLGTIPILRQHISGLFGPHPPILSAQIQYWTRPILNVSKTGRFLDLPTQFTCWRNIGMVP